MIRLSLCLLLLLVVLSSLVSAVPVPYGLCSSAGAHIRIQTVEANTWPPVSGETLYVNVTGTLNKNVSDGEYTINVALDGIPIPPITGDIDEFKPTPWYSGPLVLQFSQDIPSGILKGTTCTMEISAVDQDNTQLFCIKLAFTFGSLQQSSIVVPELPPVESRHRNAPHHTRERMNKEGQMENEAVGADKHARRSSKHARSHGKRPTVSPLIPNAK